MGTHDSIDGGSAVRLTWSRAEVCHALGISEQTFAARQSEMTAAGFPGKVPGLNAWSIAAVTAWVAGAGVAGGARPPEVGVEGDIFAELMSDVERRYAGVGGRGW